MAGRPTSTSSELADAIRAVNHKSDASNILKANENIVIPGILAAPITEKTIPVARDFEVRAVYLTGVMAASDHGLRIIKHWREVGGNAVVFDIKDSDGSVNIPFEHPLLGQHKVYIHDVPKLVHFLHQQNMHAIARIAIFRDERLVVEHPELAVQSRKNKQAWRENGKLVWTDPSNPKVQDYDIALAKHVAQLGVDEIQFDYVRFPAEGDQKDAQFVFQGQQADAAQAATAQAEAQQESCGDGRLGRPADAKQGGTETHSTSKSSAPCAVSKPKGPQRTDVITAFLKKAYAELHPTGVLLSLDVFGVMAWQRQVDLAHTGQDIVGMAHYCDVLSPMIYPSHFFGMDNIPTPATSPRTSSASRWTASSSSRTDGQRRRHSPLAASLPLAHEDLFARIHQDSGGNRPRKRRHRILVLERRQRLLQALHRHARNEGGRRQTERPNTSAATNCRPRPSKQP